MGNLIAGAQMYTLRDYCKTPSDSAETLKKVREIGYKVVQVSGMAEPKDAKQMKRLLDDSGLSACSTHTGYTRIVEETEKVIEEHKILGCEAVICPGLPGELHNGEGYLKVAKDFEKVIDINVKGVFLCAKYATPLLAASQRGVMILIASGAGIRGPSSSIAYGASKAAVNGLGMTLEHYLGARNIRVNVVCPGEIDTRLKTDVIAYQAERVGKPGEAAVEQARQTRLGTPEGVARILTFLASDEADYVRGIIFTR